LTLAPKFLGVKKQRREVSRKAANDAKKKKKKIMLPENQRDTESCLNF
jgi:hypothetical protein